MMLCGIPPEDPTTFVLTVGTTVGTMELLVPVADATGKESELELAGGIIVVGSPPVELP